MKPNKFKKTTNPYKKGNAYARSKGRQFLLSILTVFAVVFAIMLLQDLANTFLMCGLAGTTSIAMMVIGSIDDVSDRYTSGQKIAMEIYLIQIHQIDRTQPFPMPNANREVGQIPMLAGQYMQYFQAHNKPTFVGSGEKGDVTTSGTNTFTAIMGGMRDKLLDFIEQYAGDKFVILFHEVESSQWYILGSYEDPMILSSFEGKHDGDGRYVTYTFTRSSVNQYYKYAGSLVTAPAATHTADATTLAINSTTGLYNIPGGTTATYDIAAVSGLAAADKGRYITLIGTGESNAATVADNAVFTLIDGATWTATNGSRITFVVLDSGTLVEVAGSRVQAA